MRKELIERLRDATEGPRMLMGEAADMLEADAVPPGYGWLTACDEEMICYHLGVANLSDSYESAKRKLRALIDLNVAIATDPAVNGGMSLQPAVPQEPVAYLAWRDGKPCWEGDDCVCADAVYPVDHYDDRTSMPVYLAPQQQTATSDEWLANCPQSVRDLANKIKAEMAVPQEPVAILNHAHGLHAIRSVKLDGLPDGEYKLYAAPQRPRLTDDEIVEWTDAVIRKEAFNRPIAIEIAKQAARWAEKKVRGEA